MGVSRAKVTQHRILSGKDEHTLSLCGAIELVILNPDNRTDVKFSFSNSAKEEGGRIEQGRTIHRWSLPVDGLLTLCVAGGLPLSVCNLQIILTEEK